MLTGISICLECFSGISGIFANGETVAGRAWYQRGIGRSYWSLDDAESVLKNGYPLTGPELYFVVNSVFNIVIYFMVETVVKTIVLFLVLLGREWVPIFGKCSQL